MADSSSVSLCGAVRLVSMVFQVSGCVAEREVLFGGVVCFVACLRLLFVRVTRLQLHLQSEYLERREMKGHSVSDVFV